MHPLFKFRNNAQFAASMSSEVGPEVALLTGAVSLSTYYPARTHLHRRATLASRVGTWSWPTCGLRRVSPVR
jgi:hypothetical protein